MSHDPLMSDQLPEGENTIDSGAVDPSLADDLLTVTLITQYGYCARKAYYHTCLPDIRPRTYKMLAGEVAHEQERKRAERRTLFAYQLEKDAGKRQFEVWMHSTQLGLTGIVDEVVLLEDRALVVDYKLTDRSSDNHQAQLAAYALLVEERFNLPVELGYIYLMRTRTFEKVPITASLRNSVLEAVKAIRYIRENEYMPPPTKQRTKCDSCEVRRFCVDI